MQLRRNFLLSVGILVAFNVLLAFGAIGLFTRMGPAIERILQDNVYSTEAAEEMLALLARPSIDPTSAVRQRQFEEALQRAKNNTTELEEVPSLRRIEQHYIVALAGDDIALAVVVQALQQLTAINRQAMVSTDQEAQRLGNAGAWVAVFIAVFSFGISLIIIHRLERRVLNPLVELHDVLEAVRVGNSHRRCRALIAPDEIRQVLNSVNFLLDRSTNGNDGSGQRPTRSRVGLERSALLYVLEQQPDPLVLVDEHGAVVASNSHGLAVLSSPYGERVRQQLGQLPMALEHDESIVPVALRGTPGWLCVLHPLSVSERESSMDRYDI
jgi:hypothetical protein